MCGIAGLFIKLGLLVAVPVLLRKFGAALRGSLFLIGAGLIGSAIFGHAAISWLLFGFVLLLMLSHAVFKMAIGAAGAWFYYGGVPKKEPCRVRQVISIQAQQPVPAPLAEQGQW